MSQARVQRELEASEPWRKAGFKVKPYYGNDQEDAKRFVKELPTQLDLDLLKDDWTKGDVVRGDHEGHHDEGDVEGDRRLRDLAQRYYEHPLSSPSRCGTRSCWAPYADVSAGGC